MFVIWAEGDNFILCCGFTDSLKKAKNYIKELEEDSIHWKLFIYDMEKFPLIDLQNLKTRIDDIEIKFKQ